MKVLFIDLETSPAEGFVWGKYEQDVIEFTAYTQILCISWKWLDRKEVYAMALPDYKGYKGGRDHMDDKKLVADLWDLLDKADVVIAHNGDRFDVKVANARFVYHGMRPPSPYQTVDTKKVAKKIGMFPSNKLDDLGSYLKAGNKVSTGGFELWKGCMAGDAESWKKMKRYNKQDIVLLEKIYKKLLPYITNHPNFNAYQDNEHMNCPNCGGTHMQRRGFRVTRTGRKQSYQCAECGAWAAGRHMAFKPILR